jgi:hypothetical protein
MPSRASAISRAAGARTSAAAKGVKTARRKSKLPQTARSKTEEQMHERLATLEPGTIRYRVLVSAIEFKRSWLDLAQHLTEVARSGGFKEWGYRTFEAYAQHELHIRRDTALKLTRSFDFLQSHEPSILESVRSDDNGAPAVPNYQALDILAEARANPHLAERDYRTIRDQVFGEDISPSQLKKLVKERAKEPPSEKTAEDPQHGLRRCLQLAERLYGMLLEEGDLPDRIAKAVEEAVGGLRRLLEE